MPTVYATAPRDAADDLAARLVDERLAACVNVVDCESTYRWEGTVHHDEEAVLFAKTTDGRVEALMTRLAALHPHEVPCIERFEESAVADPFAQWRTAAVEDAD